MSSSSLNNLRKELKSLANPKKAELLSRFFKTGKGEYGEGDVFLGITVPLQRGAAKKYDLSLDEIQELLNSKIHEHRLTSLFILIKKYKKSEPDGKKEIFNFYLKNTKRINNWDLVDLSAPNIVGDFLLHKNRAALYKLAKSESIWERRIAVLSTSALIRNNEFDDASKISELLLNDKHDLIHKAAGWMLREVGKRDKKELERFLDRHCRVMPRTMLRYAIEKLDEGERLRYLRG